ncbi:N-acetylglucosamine kinase [Robertkochia solimangrovi]|uniref:N-acetylglucosamine kinase n=1 Tax=Robertkochia solimangrovi TaxID=2213046 RepID=UPI00117EA117|nr:N-acetylglucosamine kinase [Robertkochia solimangrovi]TRZ44435.1 N-acetylglucosamine kinase [Robertkochia solimangrovi]
MILIADGGSTKCDWIITGEDGNDIQKCRTTGINPSLVTKKMALEILSGAPLLMEYKNLIGQVYFYGAGCGLEKYQNVLKKVFDNFFENAEVIRVREDLDAAVYSCTTSPGIVSILGTGSNCCYFDGKNIETRMPSMGYTLMDDASGNNLGKRLLRAYYFKQMPQYLADAFELAYDVDPGKVKKRLYKKSHPNAFLATYARFIFEHPEDEFLQGILKDSIRSFADTHLHLFAKEAEQVPVHFVGSIAYYARKAIIEVLRDEYGMTCGNFIRRPIDGLLLYHTGDR